MYHLNIVMFVLLMRDERFRSKAITNTIITDIISTMSTLIARMLQAIYPPSEMRVLIVALDATGKTTMLYQLKLGELVTTIPTIGFNVETVLFNGVNITMWDVGGCDKIRPLWRHYYQNTQGIIFVIDSNDRQRIEEAGQELRRLLAEVELYGAKVLIFANKQDIHGAMTVEEISDRIALNEIGSLPSSPVFTILPCCAITGEGLNEGMTWLTTAISNTPNSDSPPPPPPRPPSTQKQTREQEEAARHEELLTEWLERQDDPDDLFLSKLVDYTLDSWDHYTHLRIAWLYLSKYGRREGLEKIFAGIKAFIANSPRTVRASGRGTTFHETMTYFWAHMVHYAMVATPNPTKEFKVFLLLNPQFVNGGLFLHYYSKNRMLMDADARVSVVLPDLRPLPSLVVNSTASGNIQETDKSIDERGDIKPCSPLTDQEFLDRFRKGTLSGWGHDSMLRVVYLMLQQKGRSGHSTNEILDILAQVEGDNPHVTLNYFWLQMVTYYMAVVAKCFKGSRLSGDANSGDDITSPQHSYELTFNEFMAQPRCQPLRNQLLYQKYYSNSVIDRSSQEFALPDLKQFPTLITK